MSYKPASTKSAYGDTDFTYEDNWSNQGSSQQNFEPPFQGSAGSTNPQPVVSQPDNLQQNRPPQPNYALTNEDILFMRNCTQDYFFKRFIPLSALAEGALFLYKRKYNLPHKLSHYVAVSAVTFVVGKFFYKNEFKRRVFESQLNTPYMQSLRHMLLANNPATQGNWNSNQQANDLYQPPTGYIGLDNPNPDNNLQPAFEPINQNLSPSKNVSYDELRAKNRGFAR